MIRDLFGVLIVVIQWLQRCSKRLRIENLAYLGFDVGIPAISDSFLLHFGMSLVYLHHYIFFIEQH